eukprot:tig00020556_g10976.t1
MGSLAFAVGALMARVRDGPTRRPGASCSCRAPAAGVDGRRAARAASDATGGPSIRSWWVRGDRVVWTALPRRTGHRAVAGRRFYVRQESLDPDEFAVEPESDARPAARKPPTSLANPPAKSQLASMLEAELAGLLRRFPPKRVLIWTVFWACVWYLRGSADFLFCTFVFAYIGNSAVTKMERRFSHRLACTVLFFSLLLAAVGAFALYAIPPAINEGKDFLLTLQSENPYVYLTQRVRAFVGDSMAARLEGYVLSNPEIDMGAWTEGRSRRMGLALQRLLAEYTGPFVQSLGGGLATASRTLFSVALAVIFSFLIVSDLPRISRGVRSLRYSSLGSVYAEVAPPVANFGVLLGRAFEAQTLIAVVNVLLTAAGLLFLRMPAVGFLSVVTFFCSFVPVAGVAFSTIPMAVLALEAGISKVAAVIGMVSLVHAVEAYVLNPAIYASQLHLHPLLVLSVLFLAEHLCGVWGLVLAVPTTVYIIKHVLRIPLKSKHTLEIVDEVRRTRELEEEAEKEEVVDGNT